MFKKIFADVMDNLEMVGDWVFNQPQRRFGFASYEEAWAYGANYKHAYVCSRRANPDHWWVEIYPRPTFEELEELFNRNKEES